MSSVGVARTIESRESRMSIKGTSLGLIAGLAVALAMAAAAPAGAVEYGITPGTFKADAYEEDQATPETQAGAHPDLAVAEFKLNTVDKPLWIFPSILMPTPIEETKQVSVLLPPGFAGNLRNVPRCPQTAMELNQIVCPAASQVGMAMVRLLLSFSANPGGSALYNMEPSRGEIAQLAFHGGVPVRMSITARPEDGYRVRATVHGTTNVARLIESRVTLWGVPADPSNDDQRCHGSDITRNGVVESSTAEWDMPHARCLDPASNAPVSRTSELARKPLLSNPTSCEPKTTEIAIRSWQQPDVARTDSFTAGPVVGCDRVPFEPSFSVGVADAASDGPAGLAVHLRVPQSDTPDGLATAHLRDVEVTLPEGMTINPAAADGLQACTDDQLAVSSSVPVTCPDAARIGTVVATSPALDDPVEGSVYVGSQRSDDPESGEMFRIFLNLVDRERGLNVKLLGNVRADAETGRLVASFADNPQLPVETIDVTLKGGSRAPLALPRTCGRQTMRARLTSWAGHDELRTDSFAIPCGTDEGFAPSFEAGSTATATGGAFSPFAARIARSDGQQFLSGVSVDLPKGLLAQLRGVALCPDAVAGEGTPGVCPPGSRVGMATVGAGSGSPFYLDGMVYLTGPYRGAPYGLSVQVPAKAGPFDLGTVKVRQAIHVDAETAEISVVSDSLPQVVKGVPVRLRDVRVETDRPAFTINPTSCAPQRARATLASVDGAVHRSESRFQAADCQALAFRPRMTMRLSGRRQMRTGAHPELKTVLSQGKGQSNIRKATVTLPRSIVLDATNSYDPKLVCDYDRSLSADCPASSVVGKATAVTPLLNRSLSGPVHLVQGIRFGPTGNRIRTTPSLLVKLRGEVAINLRGRTTTERGTNRLVTTFSAVPDAPVSKFTLRINGGSKGILTVTRTRQAKLDLCSASQVASIETEGQNGRRADFRTRIKTPCARASGGSSKRVR